MQIQRQSVLTCPLCGRRTRETMPTDACWYLYPCKGCGEILQPRPGDCCVFCSYGTIACPPVQQDAACCAGSPRNIR
jgi:hypothetical protein